MFIIDVFSALLTPVIAGVAVYIAWQQWKTNRQRLNLDRYDRRLHIYEEVIRILSLISRDAGASFDDLVKFRISVSEADFLFGPEIRKYINEIYRRGLNLARCNEEYKDRDQVRPENYDHKKVVEEMHIELRWLIEQFEPARDKFKKYLDISK